MRCWWWALLALPMALGLWCWRFWPFHRRCALPRRGPSAPSSLYRGWVWRVALAAVRWLPRCMVKAVCLALAELYYRFNHSRRAVVIENLLPVVQGDLAAARKTAHRLFHEFALKLLELWRVESGLPVKSWSVAPGDWALVEEARRRGQGILLITPHLGNWELGGPLLAQRGIKLLVLTQAEPGRGFTELRAASRARWGIETLVIGGDGFEFLEVIKRLQAGAVVALLLDRPPQPKAVTIELFGRPFHASIAAAELARASGCALLGVTIVRQGNGYAARILPEFSYDRAALRSRDPRRELTQRILRAFEPEIRRHADQWFHFVPLW